MIYDISYILLSNGTPSKKRFQPRHLGSNPICYSRSNENCVKILRKSLLFRPNYSDLISSPKLAVYSFNYISTRNRRRGRTQVEMIHPTARFELWGNRNLAGLSIHEGGVAPTLNKTGQDNTHNLN